MLFRKKDAPPARGEMHEIKDIMENPIEEAPAPYAPPAPVSSAPKDLGAPLFVKVEKYREILTTLQEMKLFVASMKQLFTLMHELETLRGDTVNIMRATVQRLEKSMIEVDAELLRPKGVSMGTESSMGEVTHIEDTLTDLQRQLSDLRKELHGMR